MEIIMERIIRKNVENEIRINAQKKMIPCPCKKEDEDGTFWSTLESGVRPLNFASLDSLFRNCTYEEAAEKLKRAFDEAAEEYGISVDKLRFVKGWGQGSVIQGSRLETDEELEARIQKETDEKVATLRWKNQQKRNSESQRKKKIEQLEKELASLKK